MTIERNQAYDQHVNVTEQGTWKGTRIKDVRDTALHPGGRAEVTLFEKVDDDGRAHPRFRTSLPPAADPATESAPFITGDPTPVPTTAENFNTWLRAAWEAVKDHIEQVDPGSESTASREHMVNSARAQRKARFFAEVSEWIERWSSARTLSNADGARYAMRRLEAEVFAGKIQFEDQNTGTYHSFGHDAPFVHYLEAMIASLPEETDSSWQILDATQQESVRRQRDQARNHLDHLMRHKYANDGIQETDIERSLGGFLIDRQTRRIVSETPVSHGSLVPQYELLRIAPQADHLRTGEWVYRDGQGGICLQDGTPVEVEESLLRSTPVDAERLSFRRAPDDDRLRPNIRFDWDGNGYVQPEPIGWIGWAGHCDIKAIMEALGITLSEHPKVTEYRSDTGGTQVYDRSLLLEMVASVFELGSSYRRADGSGYFQRGVHLFGGARNDSRPDRLQFTGEKAGEGFRWPLTGRQDVFRITGIQVPNGEGLETIDADLAFFRFRADLGKLEISPNPTYIKTVEGDYNIIDVSGGVLVADVISESFDKDTGYPVKETVTTTIDLGRTAPLKRAFLGTHMKDAQAREIYKVYLDRRKQEILAIPFRYEKGSDGYKAKQIAGQSVRITLAKPMEVTLSREMKRDDPEMFQSLIQVALRDAQNICADTDMQAEVWNGVVTRMEVEKKAENLDSRVESWSVYLQARFGRASLDYLLQRDARGEPVAWCPVPGESSSDRSPDFLWQDFPDVASKGMEQGDWIINDAMLERGIVESRHQPGAPGDFYVYDDHVKNLFEVIFCGLGEWPYTVVHMNKRYGFRDEAQWRAAVSELEDLRKKLSFS